METTSLRLKDEIEFEIKHKSDLNSISWQDQEGILISVQDGLNIMNLIESANSILFMMGENGFKSNGEKTLDESILKLKDSLFKINNY